MKLILIASLLLYSGHLCLANDDIDIVVIPSVTLVSEGQEVDLDVYIVNNSNESIDAPPTLIQDKDGYSGAAVSFYSESFKFDGKQLINNGSGAANHLVVDGGTAGIAAWTSKHYKFRWKCNSKNFDILVLDVEMSAGKETQRTSVTFKPAPQGDADQPANVPESKSEASDKPQPRADER